MDPEIAQCLAKCWLRGALLPSAPALPPTYDPYDGSGYPVQQPYQYPSGPGYMAPPSLRPTDSLAAPVPPVPTSAMMEELQILRRRVAVLEWNTGYSRPCSNVSRVTGVAPLGVGAGRHLALGVGNSMIRKKAHRGHRGGRKGQGRAMQRRRAEQRKKVEEKKKAEEKIKKEKEESQRKLKEKEEKFKEALKQRRKMEIELRRKDEQERERERKQREKEEEQRRKVEEWHQWRMISL
ncbi:GRB10-interacting GYF protein 2-like [Prorops nasuta]|uniref:GRB10-interacting GYF protein 2-like n=1 Tax=Prorops nasuta TaxID=863751 RepID=UPI0034CD87E0